MSDLAFLENITVNTQSSIRVSAGNTVIYADPLDLPSAPRDADVILITHEHYDHFSREDIAKVSKPDTLLVAPLSMKNACADFEHTLFVSPENRYTAKGISFETTPAYNPAKPFHPKAKGWVGYLLSLPGAAVYIAGDTDNIEPLRNIRCDIAMVPIGGTYTMNVKEAAALVNAMRPQAVIPIHYGSIVGSRKDAEVFRSKVDAAIPVVTKLFPEDEKTPR